MISDSVDDRKPNESTSKSRYDSIDMYLHPENQKFNDIPVQINETALELLQKADIDPILAKHVAHLFIRDPISAFSGRVEVDDEKTTEHFESIQSTNWQTMRFKPPPLNSSIGWRVEFRPTEIQISDFENAAFACFIVLASRAILTLDLKTVIPISKVDENMKVAHHRDAVLNEKFWFKTDLLSVDAEIAKLSINEIVNGGPNFNGLLNLIEVCQFFLRKISID